MAFVYVMRAEGGPVKIGVAADPQQRLSALATGTPLRLSLAHVEAIKFGLRATTVERAAHLLLAPYRVRGEWFDVSVERARSAIDAAVQIVRARILRRSSVCNSRGSNYFTIQMTITQCKMARAGLEVGIRELERSPPKWTPVRRKRARQNKDLEPCTIATRSGTALAELACVSTNTVTRFESGADLKERTVEALQRSLEAAGAEFTYEGGEGVKLWLPLTVLRGVPARKRRHRGAT